MNIVFMGTPEFAVPSLEALLHSEDTVVGVVTQPDRPKGRGGGLTPPPIKLICQRERIPFVQPTKMKELAFLETLRAWKPDLITVAAVGRILPTVILDLPQKGCVNVHASLLPKYRGAGPIQWAIIDGEKETGITTMMMDAGMDTERFFSRSAFRLVSKTRREPCPRSWPKWAGGSWSKPSVGSKPAWSPLSFRIIHKPRWLHSSRKKMARSIGACRPRILPIGVHGLSPWPGSHTHAGEIDGQSAVRPR